SVLGTLAELQSVRDGSGKNAASSLLSFSVLSLLFCLPPFFNFTVSKIHVIFVYTPSNGNTPLTNKPVPLWISEMGAGPNDQPKFLTSMCRYIQERELNWAWWPLNVGKKPNSEEIETWGLVNSDWNKSLDDWRLKLIQQLMNTQNDQFKEVNH
ncbi:hypothetical protein CMK21_20005, partial [Candidatus Poribacteria bacterium]|nr:hypothetical protein [Candidatus Poribacteria bacterium]